VIWVEALAAALVALALLVLVLSPLVSHQVPVAAPDDEPVELDETRRGAALLALREIEFDRATGKLSDEDYATLKARYTTAALAALREDAGGDAAAAGAAAVQPSGASDVEALIAHRRATLDRQGAATAECPTCGPRPEADARYCSSCGRLLEDAGRQVVA